jgi:DNA-binding Lrp family transcriptional regulator
MSNLDLKDRKILYQLDLNCRQSNAQIGKKVGLSKQVVDYRIKRMENNGVITFFWTAINTFNLGYDVFRIYITFHYVNLEKKNEIIQYFVSCRNAWAVISHTGEIDLTVIFWVKDKFEFYQFWYKTLDLYEEFFHKTSISLYIKTIDFKKTYLTSDSDKQKIAQREFYSITCSRKTIELDETDYILLNKIAVNARVPLIELSKRLNRSSQNVKYRIEKLIKNGIIKAFRVSIDYSKLNLIINKLDIYLKDHKFMQSMLNYLKNQHYLQCLNIAIGWADIEPEFVVEDIDELKQIMYTLEKKFPNSIKKYTYWITGKLHKERWLPEMEFK